jgi:hypothetical protein
MHIQPVNVYNPKILVLKAEMPRKRDVMNIDKMFSFAWVTLYLFQHTYICTQARIYYIPEITTALNMQWICRLWPWKVLTMYIHNTNMLTENELDRITISCRPCCHLHLIYELLSPKVWLQYRRGVSPNAVDRCHHLFFKSTCLHTDKTASIIHIHIYIYIYTHTHIRRSRWPCGLRSRSAAARLMGSRIRILLRAWIISCVCCVFCRYRPLRRADQSFKLILPSACLVVCDVETLTI